MKLINIYLSFLFVSFMSLPYPVQAADQQNSAEISDMRNPMQDAELRQRGKQLRTDIDQKYKELAESHRLTLNTSIDDVVGKYILIGMSFEDAEGILRSAGFTYTFTGKSFDTPHLTAVVDLPTPRFSRTEVAIYLIPVIQNDFHSNVRKRFAIISHAAL